MVFLSAAARPCECTFVDGKAEGMGIYRWTDGVTYVGEFKAGVIEGKGFIKYPDNEMYEGDFKTDIPMDGAFRCYRTTRA